MSETLREWRIVHCPFKVLTQCVWCAGVLGPGSPSAWHTTFESGIKWRWGSISLPLVAGDLWQLVRFPCHQTLEARKCITPHLYLYSILGSVCVCENDTFAALFQHIYMHLLVERVFVRWRWIILTVTERNKLKLKENICYWSVHVTSHLRDMRSILNAVHSVRVRHGEMCLGKYLCLYFFKEYKVL